MERRLGPLDSLLTGARGEAIELARQAAERGASLVVAVGGDGTVSEVVNGLMRAEGRPRDLALGIVPAGTGADLARSLDLPSSQDEALRLLLEGQRLPLDVGRVEYDVEGGGSAVRFFVNVASLGIEGVVDRNIQSAPRFLGGRVAYGWAAFGALATFRPQRVVLRCGQLEMRRSVLAAVLANGRFFGGGMQIAPDARLDDGRLELVVLRGVPLWRLAFESRRLYNGSIYESETVEHFSLTMLEAKAEGAERVWLGIDGEPLGQLPARFSLVPGALQVIRGA
jgi:YegS/Rv2252/BmrU family lipid kinase